MWYGGMRCASSTQNGDWRKGTVIVGLLRQSWGILCELLRELRAVSFRIVLWLELLCMLFWFCIIWWPVWGFAAGNECVGNLQLGMFLWRICSGKCVSVGNLQLGMCLWGICSRKCVGGICSWECVCEEFAVGNVCLWGICSGNCQSVGNVQLGICVCVCVCGICSRKYVYVGNLQCEMSVKNLQCEMCVCEEFAVWNVCL